MIYNIALEQVKVAMVGISYINIDTVNMEWYRIGMQNLIKFSNLEAELNCQLIETGEISNSFTISKQNQ